MVVETLFDDDIVAVAAAENPWTRRRRIKLAELVNEPWTLPPRDTGIGTFAVGAFHARGLEPPQAVVVTYSMHMCHKLLATGRFLSMLSSYTLMLPGKHPWLKALPVDLANARGTIAIITLKNRTLSPVIERFIDCAREVTRPMREARSARKR